MTAERAVPVERHLADRPIWSTVREAASIIAVRRGDDLQELAARLGMEPEELPAAPWLGDRLLDPESPFPVVIQGPYAHAPAARALRWVYRQSTGSPLEDGQPEQLAAWLAERHESNTVAEFDIDHGPNPASPQHGGWYYAERRQDTPAGVYFQHRFAG